MSAGVPLVAYANTFRLSSNPTARTTIYLDFDGHTTQGTLWNDSIMGASFYSPATNIDGNASSFSTAELTLIQQAWQRVASDFAPFDVNVTTLAPPDDWLIKTIGANDPNDGIRVVMSSYGPSSTTAGGIAYINSFNWDSDTPCFVYNTSLVGVSEAVSHEVGHTLGLSHDGTLSGASYYSGHGSGENGWASIMGVGYYQNVTTWDNGTFPTAITAAATPTTTEARMTCRSSPESMASAMSAIRKATTRPRPTLSPSRPAASASTAPLKPPAILTGIPSPWRTRARST